MKLITRDNFWNIIVFICVILTLAIGESNGMGLLWLVCSVTVVPYLLTRFNEVKYLEDGTCVNSQGEDLTARIPRNLANIMKLEILLIIVGNFFGLFNILTKIPHGFAATTFIGVCILFT